MENELSNRNIVKMNNNNKFYFNNKDKDHLKVCLYHCECDCHKYNSQINKQNLLHNKNINITPLFINSKLIKRNSF